MNKIKLTRLLTMLLAWTMLLSLFACNEKEQNVSTTSEQTELESIETTQPNGTVETDETELGSVETAQSKETEPEETKPEETKPEETKPEETNPEETNPEETKPEETKPEETKPEETKPEETKPEETKPEETKPEETNPEETNPEETDPRVEIVDKFVSAEDISTAMGTTKYVENVVKKDEATGETYAHIAGTTATSGASYRQFVFTDNTTVTGQYLIIKYRSNSTYNIEFVASSTSITSVTNGNQLITNQGNDSPMNTDGEWAYAIFDLSAISNAVTQNDDGTYTVASFGWRLFRIGEMISADTYIDLAYMAFSDDLADFEELVGEDTVKYYYYQRSAKDGSDGSTNINCNSAIKDATMAEIIASSETSEQ